MSDPHPPWDDHEFFHETIPGQWEADWPHEWITSIGAGFARLQHEVRGGNVVVMDQDETLVEASVISEILTASTETVVNAARAQCCTHDELHNLGVAASVLGVIAQAVNSPSGPSENDDDLMAARNVFQRLSEAVWSALETRVVRVDVQRFQIRWRQADIAMAQRVSENLDSLLESDDPAIARLFPAAYGDDTERSRGYDALARSELIELRRASLRQLQSTFDLKLLSEPEMEATMRSVNDLRLMLGTQLGLSEAGPPPGGVDPEMMEAYERLSRLLSHIIDALCN